MNLWQEIKQSFKHGNNLNKLIYINVGVFLAIKLIAVFGAIFMIESHNVQKFITNIFILPAKVDILIFRFWTIITYMFSHEGFLHFIFNLLWLYWMGRIFIEYLNGKRLLTVYLTGGITGGILFILTYNLVNTLNPNAFAVFDSSYLIGASASIMAITFAIAAYLPDYRINLLFIGPVKLKWIALVSLLLDLTLVTGANWGGHIAHIGGSLFGLYWGLQLKQGKDITKKTTRLLDNFFTLFQKKSNMKVSYRNTNQTRTRASSGYTPTRSSQEEMDKILDKIKQSGYESLTQKEKEILLRMGNKKQ